MSATHSAPPCPSRRDSAAPTSTAPSSSASSPTPCSTARSSASTARCGCRRGSQGSGGAKQAAGGEELEQAADEQVGVGELPGPVGERAAPPGGELVTAAHRALGRALQARAHHPLVLHGVQRAVDDRGVRGGAGARGEPLAQLVAVPGTLVE